MKNYKEALEIHCEYMRAELEMSYPAWIGEQIKEEVRQKEERRV